MYILRKRIELNLLIFVKHSKDWIQISVSTQPNPSWSSIMWHIEDLELNNLIIWSVRSCGFFPIVVVLTFSWNTGGRISVLLFFPKENCIFPERIKDLNFWILSNYKIFFNEFQFGQCDFIFRKKIEYLLKQSTQFLQLRKWIQQLKVLCDNTNNIW